MNRLPHRWSAVVTLAVLCAAGAWAQTVTPTSLPNGEVGVAYNQTLTANGFLPILCCSWTLTPGTGWPGGLSFSSGGTTATISGTPTSAGSISFTVTATDGTSSVTDQPYTITIIAGPTINQTSLPTQDVGAYSQTLTASGGTPSYTWSVFSGALPTGTSLNSSTGAISGSASAGTYNFTIQ